MSIIAKNSGNDFVPAPAGQHQAVCVDVIDLGMVEREYDGQKTMRHEIRIVFQIAARMENGKRFLVATKALGLNLSSKGHLRPFLENWGGRVFTDDEIKAGFDVERLVGVNALLNVVHNTVKDNIYANIGTIMPWNQQFGALIQAEDYVRKADRPSQAGAAAGQPQTTQPVQQPPAQQPNNFYQPTVQQGVAQDDIPF